MPLLDILNKVLTDTGLGGTVTTVNNLDEHSDQAKVIKWINDAQKDVARDVPNAQLAFYGNISTVDDDSDTVSVTNGSSTVTFTNATDTDWVGRLLHIQGDSQVYRIGAVPSSTTVTLADFAGATVNYRGTTNASATAEIAQDRYLLPLNYKAPVTLQDFFTPATLKYMSPEEYDIAKFDEDGTTFKLGYPQQFTIFSAQLESGRPRYWVEFRPIPDDVYYYPFRYYGEPVDMENDEDVSGYSGMYEQAIIAKARSYVYRYAIQNEGLAIMEERDYLKIVNKQQTNPVQGRHTFQIQPETGRAHWSDAYG